MPYTFQKRRAGESKLDARETVRFIRHLLDLSLADVSATEVAVTAVALLLLSARPTPDMAAVLIGGGVLFGLFRKHTTGIRRALADIEVEQAGGDGAAQEADTS